MIVEGRNVLLFLDKAPSHHDIFQEGLKNIKLEFHPKNTMSRLQSCNAGIIRNFKHKYRKLLIRRDMVKHELQVTSCELRVESLKARVETQKHELNSNPRVTRWNPRVTCSNSRVTSSNPRVQESLNH